LKKIHSYLISKCPRHHIWEDILLEGAIRRILRPPKDCEFPIVPCCSRSIGTRQTNMWRHLTFWIFFSLFFYSFNILTTFFPYENLKFWQWIAGLQHREQAWNMHEICMKWPSYSLKIHVMVFLTLEIFRLVRCFPFILAFEFW